MYKRQIIDSLPYEIKYSISNITLANGEIISSNSIILKKWFSGEFKLLYTYIILAIGYVGNFLRIKMLIDKWTLRCKKQKFRLGTHWKEAWRKLSMQRYCFYFNQATSFKRIGLWISNKTVKLFDVFCLTSKVARSPNLQESLSLPHRHQDELATMILSEIMVGIIAIISSC